MIPNYRSAYSFEMAASASQPIVVLITFPSSDEANRVAAVLVDEHFAACVNVLPGVRSLFFWEGARTDAEEVLAVVKTTQQRFVELADRVRQLHSYSVPEVIALPIVAGEEPYLNWIADTVTRP